MLFCRTAEIEKCSAFCVQPDFYGWGEPRYIVLMIVSIVSGFVFALMIEKKQNKKADSS